MNRRRAVITGAGAVTALGVTLADTRRALACGASGLRAPSLFDASSFAEPRGGQIVGFDPRPHFRHTKALKLADRPARFAVGAAAMALADAGWPATSDPADLGVMLGTSGHDLLAGHLAGAVAPDPDQRTVTDIPLFAERVLSGLTPLWLVTVLPNMVSAQVAMQVDAAGPNNTIMSDTAAGLQAIGEAAEWIWSGGAAAVLAGGADSGINPLVYAALQQAAEDDPDRLPEGIVPGEGAGIVLVEERERALARGARVYAEIVAHDSTAGDDTSLDRVARAVLASAGWTAADLRLAGGDAIDLDAPRFTVSRCAGHALAAAAPIDLAVALDGRFGRAGCRAALFAVRGFHGPSVALGLLLHPGLHPGLEDDAREIAHG